MLETLVGSSERFYDLVGWHSAVKKFQSFRTVQMEMWLRRHGVTVVAILIALLLTVVFGFMAIDSLPRATYPERSNSSFARTVGSISRISASASARGGAASNPAGIIGIVMGTVVVVSAIIIVGLAFVRAWVREAALKD
ncbi:MAG: hypothetical protein M3112_06475 [Actinomycetia bacterium]|nr:hypothetical protein [Actinomycetes bacterium]